MSRFIDKTGLSYLIQKIKDSLATKENLSNKVTSWQSTPDNTHYPSEQLVKTSLDTEAAAREAVNTRINNLNADEVEATTGKILNTISQTQGQISVETRDLVRGDFTTDFFSESQVENLVSDLAAKSQEVATETARAMAAEAALSTSISTEKSRAETAESNLSTALSSEATTRANADTSLQLSLEAESTARSSADTTLQTNINTEASTRSSADIVLGTRVDTEVADRISADTQLQTNITAEANTRSEADTALNQRIDNLDLGTVTATTGKIINSISQTNGLVTADTRDLVRGDFSNNFFSESQVENLTSDLAATIDHIQVNGTEQTITNKTVNLTTVDNVTSAGNLYPLSANQGKLLNDRITNLETLGRFLSLWNCVTGKPLTDPTTLPYSYRSGDYFRISTVDTATNYMPEGSQYTGAASTTVYSGGLTIKVGDLWFYDGTTWSLMQEKVGGFVEDVQVDNTSVVSDGVAKIDLDSFGISATSSEINVLDGITATTTELNYTDGVTGNIQTQLDNKVTLDTAQDISATKTFTSNSKVAFNPQTNSNIDVSAVSDTYSNTLKLKAGNTTGTVPGNTELQVFYNYNTGRQVVMPSTNATSTTGVELGREGNMFRKLWIAGSITDGTNSITTEEMCDKQDDLTELSTFANNKYLHSNKDTGTLEWADADALPAQAGHSGDYLTTDGVTASWGDVDSTPTEDSANLVTSGGVYTAVDAKQDTLVSGTNIKTINSTSLLGSGDITIDPLPTQSGHAGEFLTTDGTDASWDALPNEVVISTTEPTDPEALIWIDTNSTGSSIDSTPTQGSTNAVSSGGVYTALLAKQDTLVSGTNIKTINNQTVLGSGDISTTELPSQSGHSGGYLTTNGTDASWGTTDSTPTEDSANLVTSGGVYDALDAKQDTLVSGTNIKTINSTSLLGSGNVDIDALPSQSGHSGQFLTTNGSDASWATVDALPTQTGHDGEFLTTDGSDASWSDLPAEVAVQTTEPTDTNVLLWINPNGTGATIDATPTQGSTNAVQSGGTYTALLAKQDNPTVITGTLTAGSTSITLSNSAITTSSVIDIYTDTYGVAPKTMVASTGSVTMTFKAQSSDLGIRLEVR